MHLLFWLGSFFRGPSKGRGQFSLYKSMLILLSHLLLDYLSQTPSYSLNMLTRWPRCGPVILVGAVLSGAQ